MVEREQFVQHFMGLYPNGKALLIEALLNSSVGNTVDPKCTNLLMEMEVTPGFCTILLDIFEESQSYNKTLSFLSISLCKNAINRRWKPRTGYFIRDEEKEVIKHNIIDILNNFDEIPFSREVLSITRPICRNEFPNNWDALLPTIFNHIYSGLEDQDSFQFSINKRRLFFLQLLSQTVKEQSSKRLPKDKVLTFTLGGPLLEKIGPLWLHLANHIQTTQSFQQFEGFWKASLFLDRIIVYLLAYYFDKIEHTTTLIEYFSSFSRKFSTMLRITMQVGFKGIEFDLLKNLSNNIKNLTNLFKFQPLSPIYMDLNAILRSLCNFVAGLDPPSNEEISLRVINLLKITIVCNNYWKNNANTDDIDNTLANLCTSGLLQFEQFLNESNSIAGLCDFIQTKFVSLKMDEIVQWMEDDDELNSDPLSSIWALRKETKSLFTEIPQELYMRSIIPHVISELIRSFEALSHPSIDQDIFLSTCSRCESLLSWCIVLIKMSVQSDSLFSQISNIIVENDVSKLHPLIQYRLSVLFRKALVYGTIPTFEVINVFKVLNQLLQSSNFKVKVSTIYSIKLLNEKFPDDNIWNLQDKIEIIIANLSYFLFMINNPSDCSACIELLRKLLSATNNELNVVQILAEHPLKLQALWNLQHEHIREEIVLLLQLFLLRFDDEQSREFPHFNWVLELCQEILFDYLRSHFNEEQLTQERDSFEKQLLKKMFNLWISILRIVNLNQNVEKLVPLFNPLVEFGMLCFRHDKTEEIYKVLEIILEYLSLFFNINYTSYSSKPFESTNLSILFNIYNIKYNNLVYLLTLGLDNQQSYWTVRRCLHISLFHFSLVRSDSDIESTQNLFVCILMRFLKQNEFRENQSKFNNLEKAELIKFIPEHFIPPLTCWIVRNSNLFFDLIHKMDTEHTQDNLINLFQAFQESFRKISDVITKLSITFTEISILNRFPYQINLIKQALETIFEQLQTIYQLGSPKIENFYDTTYRDSFLNSYRGSTQNGNKLPKPSRFYFAFNLCAIHPDTTSFQDVNGCFTEGLNFTLEKTYNLLTAFLNNFQNDSKQEIYSLMNMAPSIVKQYLESKTF